MPNLHIGNKYHIAANNSIYILANLNLAIWWACVIEDVHRASKWKPKFISPKYQLQSMFLKPGLQQGQKLQG